MQVGQEVWIKLAEETRFKQRGGISVLESKEQIRFEPAEGWIRFHLHKNLIPTEIEE